MASNFHSEIKDMSREERAKFFQEHKSEILKLKELDSVNGGLAFGNAADRNVKNPGSAEVPFEGNWYSSFGFVCDGQVIC